MACGFVGRRLQAIQVEGLRLYIMPMVLQTLVNKY